jgi:regulatory protein
VRLLARREHGASELANKLHQKGFSVADAEAALLECQRLGLQSDARFVESLCNQRVRQGYGPVKIRQGLMHLKIDRTLIDEVLQKEHDHWLDYAVGVWQKKYKVAHKLTLAEIQKQKQFLLYRGFASDTIAMVFKDIKI